VLHQSALELEQERIEAEQDLAAARSTAVATEAAIDGFRTQDGAGSIERLGDLDGPALPALRVATPTLRAFAERH